MKWILFSLILTGCSHSMIAKDCSRVEGEDGKFVCKTVKPWE